MGLLSPADAQESKGSANNDEDSNPYKIHLILLISLLALVLVWMILCVITPKSLEWFLCICRNNKEGKFNYIDMALYRTRHSMYRKEVYSANMRRSLFPQASNSSGSEEKQTNIYEPNSRKSSTTGKRNSNQSTIVTHQQSTPSTGNCQLNMNSVAPTVVIQICRLSAEDHHRKQNAEQDLVDSISLLTEE
ncbi:hypothetical protein Ciccas_003606 [Cichlidogyrus casuarinus]|uniref:Uncharacterized protein n=1 Tax=Cichlidogyrus casuarinus TaxID=1844966 RepID=A0ABD2QDV9_9PLAT